MLSLISLIVIYSVPTVRWIDDYFIQLAAYSQAHNETHGTDIRTGVILMCSADNLYQEFVVEEAEYDIWAQRWFDRVEQYYREN